jgi:hypothetical protein
MAMCLIALSAYPQDIEFTQDIELLKQRHHWHEGTVMLNDQTMIKGLIRYNDRDDFISFHNGDEVKIFTAKNMLQVVFADSTRTRTFISLPFEDEKKRETIYLIFEVLKEYKDFAMLLRTKPIDFKMSKGRSGGFGSSELPVSVVVTVDPYAKVSQVQTVYILDANGETMPYLEVTHRENGMKSMITGEDRRTKGKMRDQEMIAEYIGQSAYKKLLAYAKEKELSFKDKEDLMTLFSYYDSIQNEM